MKPSQAVIAVLVFALTACTDREPMPPSITAGAAANTGDVTVTSANPNNAPQDTTIDVRVLGSGFDRGSKAQWAQSGVVSPNVKTNSTKYVSSTELVANITIALTASTGSYDILVTTSKGKKGIGSELFTITLKHNDVATVTVTPPANTIVAGASVQLKATAYNATGTVLTKATFTWATNNSAVAVVSATGLMMTVGAGSATITATSGGVGGNSTVTALANLALASVSAGNQYSCGLTPASSAFCWGANDMRQLGNGSTTDVHGPSAVSGGLAFTTITIQFTGGCGLVTGGSAWCWGAVGEPTSSGGALGGGNSDTAVPVALVGGLSFTAVSEGDASACGLDAGGSAYCWGWNVYGQLGNGTTTDSPTPVPVSGGLTFAEISVGASDHACGLTNGGVAYCWGLNNHGQLGDGTTTMKTMPTAVLGGLLFASISPGWANTCGITTSGAAYCWGNNSYGQLGNGTTTSSTSPVPVSGGLNFAAISATQSSCGLTTAGAAYCWGFNKWGQLGNGTTTNSATPVPVSGGFTFATISAGGSHSCGLTTGGVAFCWGRNYNGQLGDGTQMDRWVPVKVIGQP